jgi:hypothetical protein
MSDVFCTMRNLGAVFDVSSHVIGRTLKGLGLRTQDGQPSEQAKESGLVKQVAGPQSWVSLWLWHRERTVAILEEVGFEPADQPCSVSGDVA